MSSIPPVSALAQRMQDLSAMARGAAKVADPGDYLNPPASDFASRITRRSNTVLDGIHEVRSEHARFLDTPDGIDAHAALNGAELDVRAGLAALRDGVVIEDDTIRNGDTVIRDSTATGVASSHFDAAAGRLALAADGIALRSMDDAELMARLLGPIG